VGVTRYGRGQDAATITLSSTTASPWMTLWLLGFIIAVALFIALHLSGGLHHH